MPKVSKKDTKRAALDSVMLSIKQSLASGLTIGEIRGWITYAQIRNDTAENFNDMKASLTNPQWSIKDELDELIEIMEEDGDGDISLDDLESARELGKRFDPEYKIDLSTVRNIRNWLE